MDEQPRVRRRSLVLLLTALLPALLSAGTASAHSPPGGPGATDAARAAPDTTEPAIRGPEELRRRLREILRDPSLARAHVGLVVQVAETGRVLFERAPHRRFVPASNTKIVTGAVALHELGPGHRWETRLLATGPVDDGGTLRGDLWVVGGGDPLLTRDDLGKLIERLRGAGIGRVEGDLIGDGRRFPPPIWGNGWMWTDTYSGWGAGVSALRLHPGRVRASLLPGSSLGDSARLVLRSGGPLPAIRNRVRTGAPGSDVRLDFVPDPRDEPVALEGWIPLDA
ncbi:MAG: D-alanyl-D-alanine carboxypeptidase, partial [Gemmatimonadota bacterium]